MSRSGYLRCGGYSAVPVSILPPATHEQLKAALREAAARKLRSWPARAAIEWFFATTELGIGTPINQWRMHSRGCGASDIQPGFSMWLTIQDVLSALPPGQLDLIARRWATTETMPSTEMQAGYREAMVNLHDLPPITSDAAKMSLVCRGVVPIRDWVTLPNGARIEPIKMWAMRTKLITIDTRAKT